jgi:hypothetical protein
MDENPDDLPRRTTGDYIHTTAKAALSAVPFVGGPAAELFALVLAPPLEKRRDAWLQQLYDALKRLEQQVEGFKISDLSHNEAFISATIQATQIALRTHQQQKREALRNSVLNVIRDKSLDEEKQTFFFSLIDLLTVTRLELLRLFADPARFPSQRRTELRERRAMTDPILLDLNSRGFLDDPRPYAARMRESQEGLVTAGWTLSPLGREFLSFVTERS